MTRTSRLVVALASLLLLALYLAPLWRIELVAPQYPEGLGLRIWVNQITGIKPNDLNSINGLNHYIGMRAIEPASFPELRLMPRLVAAAVVLGLLVALAGRRGLLYAWAGLFFVEAPSTANEPDHTCSPRPRTAGSDSPVRLASSRVSPSADTTVPSATT